MDEDNLEDKQYVFLDLDEQKMKHKNYDLQAYALTNFHGYIDKEKNQRIINKEEFVADMKKTLKLSKYKCRMILGVFEELGVVETDKTNKNLMYMNPVSSKFLRVLIPTLRYCFDTLSPQAFKVYCYLFNKYMIHKRYRYEENYFFSKTELINMLGYGKTQDTMLSITNILMALERLGLISYNHNNVGRPGKHGTYYELYSVSETVDEVKKAIEEIKSERPLMFNGSYWMDKEFEDGMLATLLRYPTENMEYLKYYGLDKYLGEW